MAVPPKCAVRSVATTAVVAAVLATEETTGIADIRNKKEYTNTNG